MVYTDDFYFIVRFLIFRYVLPGGGLSFESGGGGGGGGRSPLRPLGLGPVIAEEKGYPDESAPTTKGGIVVDTVILIKIVTMKPATKHLPITSAMKNLKTRMTSNRTMK